VQINALFAASIPDPTTEDLFALTVVDLPSVVGPLHRNRVRTFRFHHGRPVEAPDLSATIGGYYYPCSLMNRLHHHLSADHTSVTQLAVYDPQLQLPLLLPYSTESGLRRQLRR
jgi:hypothetical protein